MRYLLACVVVFVLGLPALMLPATATLLARDVITLTPGAVLVFAGLATGIALWCLVLGGFWRNLHHELAHVLAAVAVGARPTSLVAGEAGGNVAYRMAGPLDATRGFLISIAPYALSPLTPTLLIVVAVVPLRGMGLIFCAGVVAGIALAAPLLEVHPRQQDLRRHGLLLTLPAALWLWAGMAALVLGALPGSRPSRGFAETYGQAGNRAIQVVEMSNEVLGFSHSWR